MDRYLNSAQLTEHIVEVLGDSSSVKYDLLGASMLKSKQSKPRYLPEIAKRDDISP